MEFQKVLETRRSVRKYDPNVSVTREQMEELIRAAQEAPSWKNSQTGRYYCVLSEEIVNKIRENCLPGARNAEKSEHAALIVTTFVHNRAGFQTDGTPDNELGNGWGCYDLGLQNANLILKATDLGPASYTHLSPDHFPHSPSRSWFPYLPSGSPDCDKSPCRLSCF